MSTFNLPDVGEGLTEAEIVAWKVKPGDTVAINQVFVEIETAKSLVELPCPYAGVVTELHAAEGETLEVGAPLFIALTRPESQPEPLANVPDGAPTSPRPTPRLPARSPAPLVGSGPKADAVKRRARTGRPGAGQAPQGRRRTGGRTGDLRRRWPTRCSRRATEIGARPRTPR